ncbi:hypothetical protein [Ferrimonas senticii]|uniref:hypothetical protein n=1 Tax=Ferrimonas senticii TaxID=394566 RepID=UPI00041E5247|nr:hypothetical protein [Ferrimonas senticii]
MTKQEAEQLSLLLMQVSGKLDQSVCFVMDKDSPESFTAYRSSAGKIMGALYLEMLQPLWQRYPELLPVQMGGSYQVDDNIHLPHFYHPAPTP